jgi:CheY-like chemotaxis protein
MLAAGRRFDAMITDYRMPGTNGLTLARDAVTVCPGLVVFLLTGLSETPSLEVLRESGVAAVFGKPLDFAQLARELESALGERPTSGQKQTA